MQSIRMSHIVRVLSEFVSYKILFVSRLVRFFAKKDNNNVQDLFLRKIKTKKKGWPLPDYGKSHNGWSTGTVYHQRIYG